MSTTATMASRSVADLPYDVIRCIIDRSATECRARMRAVCSALRAAVPAEPQPWILLQSDAAAERSGRLSALSLPADRKLSLACCPAVVAGAGLGRARCFGAGHGWLALVGADDLGVTLHNPVSGAAVSLPPLTEHPTVGAGGVSQDGKILWRTWRDIWPGFGRRVPAEFRDSFVRK